MPDVLCGQNLSHHQESQKAYEDNQLCDVYLENLELDIEMPELDDFHPLIIQLKTIFVDSIKSIKRLMLHDEYKYNFYQFN